MRTFISHLLSGASAREEFVSAADAVIAGMEVHSVPVEEPVPTYARARSILQTAIERLTDRQAVLMKEIADRQAELYETNKTLDGFGMASASISGVRLEDMGDHMALGEGRTSEEEDPLATIAEAIKSPERDLTIPAAMAAPYGGNAEADDRLRKAFKEAAEGSRSLLRPATKPLGFA